MLRLRKAWDDEQGGTAILTAFLAPVLLAAVALGVEISGWYSQHRDLQRIADASALSGALAWAKGSSTTAVQANAVSTAVMNGATVSEVGTSLITWVGGYNDQALQVQVTRQVPLLLAQMFIGGSTQTIRVTSAAIRKADSRDCIVGLNSVGTAVNNIGNPSINLAGCSMSSNSNLDVTGSATVTADGVYADGTVSGTGNITAVNGIHSHAGTVPDPYADLTMPTAGASSNGSYNNATVTLNPGTYSSLDFGGHSDITLNPGTYIINNGDFNVGAQARLRGDGVTIILTGTSAATIGSVTINGGADILLKAPVEGAASGIPGVVLWQDSRATASSRINGGATTAFQGALYFPSTTIEFTGNSSGGSTGCTQIVAYGVEFRGNASLGNDCTGKGTRHVGGLAAKLVK